MTAVTRTASRVGILPQPKAVTRPFPLAASTELGQIVYINSSAKAALARGNAAGTSNAFGALVGSPAHIVGETTFAADMMGSILIMGAMTGYSGMTAGNWYYLSSAVAGGLDTAAPAGPNYVKLVGYAMDDDILFVVPTAPAVVGA